MGACLSLDQEERKARARSEEIDRALQIMAREESHIIKILLLGAGESGKSTLVKQMKIIHNDGFTMEELQSFKTTVLDNLLSSMKYVLNGMGLLRINLENPKNKVHAQTVLSCQRCFDENHVMLPFISNAVKGLWRDRGVQLAVARGYEYELNDSAIYYFENMERISSENFSPSALDVLRARVRTTGIIETCFKINDFIFSFFENMDRLNSDNYSPTSKDVLRARVRTTGIIETCFKINDVIFRLFDVGGQRSERRKWIQCFDDVRAILFVVSLSGYDMTLYEDPSVNRLRESLKLFSSICNNRFFLETSIILFMNKLDLFQEKILSSGRHMRYYFPEYTGPDCDVDRAARFIQHMYQIQNKHQGKVIYPHFTTATDTSNIQVVFQVVMDTIVRENLEAASLL